MSTAAAPMNARNRLILEFGLKIFAPACFAAAGIGLVMLYIVNAIFAEANSLDKEYTRRAAGAAVQAVQQRMENVARDNALWDDAVRNSYEPFNEPWAYEAWGVGTELGLYNIAFIVNAEGKTIFSYENGKKMDKPIAAVFGNGLIRLVARLPQDKTTFATVSALFKRNKELYAVSAAPILPSSDAVSLPQERPNNLIFAKRIDGDMLATLAQQHVLDGLSFDREDKLSGDTLSLTDYDGETIGALTWTSRRPGDIARLKYDDIIKIMIGTILAVMGTLVYFSWRNFEEANASKQNALESSLRDELTGLANRRKIISKLTETLERHPGPIGGLSIIYADLDGFKNVNDTHGHEAGDELLRAAAKGFRRIVGDRGMVARVGGDEFAIIVQTPDAAAAAREIAAAMIELLSVPMTFANHVASLGVSIGLVDSFDGPADAEEMLRRADIAMYVAKSGGRHRACVFAPQMDSTRDEARLIADELRDALVTGSLDVVYQPIVDAASLEIVSLEALVRWPRGHARIIGPDVFIPIAEEHGLIGDVGRFVLEKACREAADWPDMQICVNISPLQFKNTGFPAEVESILEQSGLDGSRLELEVTESSIIENTERAAAAIRKLHDMKVRISLDDFGSGFSSIGHLRALRFDRVKLDRSLIKEVLTSPQALLLLRATITMAEALGLPTTAEGIEREEEIPLLRLAGCHQFQGYLFSKPVPAAAITEVLLGRQELKVA